MSNAEENSIDSLARWMRVAIGMAVVAELLHTLLAGGAVFRSFIPGNKWQDYSHLVGVVFGVPAAVLWIGNRWRMSAVWQRWFALTAGFGIFFYQWLFNQFDGSNNEGALICLMLSPLGILAFMHAMHGVIFWRKSKFFQWRVDFFEFSVLVIAMSLATNAGLGITRIIFPATWDYHAFRIDAAFFDVATQVAILNASAPPIIQAFTHMVYSVLIFSFYAMIGLAIRYNMLTNLNVWRTFIIPFGLAFLLYAFLPLTGPAYAFFDNQFPDNLPHVSAIPAKQVIVPPAFRNAMPSMHLTGALLVWMLSIGLRNWIAIMFSTILVLVTAWSTMGMGEHYLIDLLVALPYAAFLGTVLIWPERLRQHWRKSVPIWLTGSVFLIWMLALRLIPEWLSESAWVVRGWALVGFLSSAVVFWNMVLSAKDQRIQTDNSAILKPQPHDAVTMAPHWVIGVFAASGVAGLIYEVVYAKALAVTFGSSSLASYTVLTTYMGGMAIGAWLGGGVADRLRNPLRAYGICEALIGIYAVLTPGLFILIQEIYVYFSLDTPPDTGWLTVLRIGLGVVCLGLPTILMGATMPLMFRYLRGLGVSSQGAIAPLYAANVVGAAVGAVMAGYLVLPAVGRDGGTYIAAVLSLFVALFVFQRDKRTSASLKTENLQPAKSSASACIQQSSIMPSVDARLGISALVILFVGGAVTLGLEVNFMHLLAVVAGNSVYAFSLMLATFLAGLGFGSHFGEWLMNRFSRIELVAWAQCGVAFSIGVTAQTWDNIPSYFSTFSIYPVQLSFAGRETIRAMVCAIAMFPAAFFIGMNYPAAMSLASDWLSPRGGAKGLGLASGINTAGNIAGVVLVGFWFLPMFGSRDSAFFLAITSLTLGVLIILMGKKYAPLTQSSWAKVSRWSPVALVFPVLLVFPDQWSQDDLATGSNVYFSAQNWGKVIDHAESVEGGITSVARSESGVLTLLTNGKFQGNDSESGEMLAQESFALFPMLHTSARDAALVIGYGTGMTTRVFHDSGFKQIDVAELSNDIVVMANRYFEKINHSVMDSSKVRMHYTDGRNFLLTQNQKFDLVSIEITSIWFAGAANLYNKDFYELTKKRLTTKGVLQQWVQLHHISPMDLAYVIGSIRSEFKYLWLYVRGGQGIIVASNHLNAFQDPYQSIAVGDDFGLKMRENSVDLRSHLVLSPAGIDRFISSIDPTMSRLVSTDSNLYLEHSTPKGNALGDVLESNLRLLSSFENANANSVKDGVRVESAN